MIVLNPKERYDSKQVLNHHWLQGTKLSLSREKSNKKLNEKDSEGIYS